MRQLIGLIMLLSIVVVVLISTVVDEIYWFIKCLKEGGDWRFYGVNLLGFGIAFLCFVAILLMAL